MNFKLWNHTKQICGLFSEHHYVSSELQCMSETSLHEPNSFHLPGTSVSPNYLFLSPWLKHGSCVLGSEENFIYWVEILRVTNQKASVVALCWMLRMKFSSHKFELAAPRMSTKIAQLAVANGYGILVIMVSKDNDFHIRTCQHQMVRLPIPVITKF